jgi:hypothetical protein
MLKELGLRDVDPAEELAVSFGPRLWAGFERDRAGKTYCRGLIEDWGSWQRENGEAFHQFCAVLRDLSPDGESLEPGPLTRIPEARGPPGHPEAQDGLRAVLRQRHGQALAPRSRVRDRVSLRIRLA